MFNSQAELRVDTPPRILSGMGLPSARTGRYDTTYSHINACAHDFRVQRPVGIVLTTDQSGCRRPDGQLNAASAVPRPSLTVVSNGQHHERETTPLTHTPPCAADDGAEFTVVTATLQLCHQQPAAVRTC